jgi:hypothetical protein
MGVRGARQSLCSLRNKKGCKHTYTDVHLHTLTRIHTYRHIHIRTYTHIHTHTTHTHTRAQQATPMHTRVVVGGQRLRHLSWVHMARPHPHPKPSGVDDVPASHPAHGRQGSKTHSRHLSNALHCVKGQLGRQVSKGREGDPVQVLELRTRDQRRLHPSPYHFLPPPSPPPPHAHSCHKNSTTTPTRPHTSHKVYCALTGIVNFPSSLTRHQHAIPP